MKLLVTASLLVVGVIHLLPVTGVVGGERLTALYGVGTGDPNLQLLLRHRAVLFGLLGSLLVVAAFRPALQPLAFVAGFVSVVSFLVLARGFEPTPQVARVVLADWIALGCLVAGAIAYYASRGAPPAA
jgi:hypothetical protein